MLIEVIADPPDFRYRLAGTLARDLTGLLGRLRTGAGDQVD